MISSWWGDLLIDSKEIRVTELERIEQASLTESPLDTRVGRALNSLVQSWGACLLFCVMKARAPAGMTLDHYQHPYYCASRRTMCSNSRQGVVCLIHHKLEEFHCPCCNLACWFIGMVHFNFRSQFLEKVDSENHREWKVVSAESVCILVDGPLVSQDLSEKYLKRNMSQHTKVVAVRTCWWE